MTVPAVQRTHIASTPDVCGGKPCIAGTRIRVQDIVVRTELGESPDEIVRAYPHLTLGDVHSALAYYYDNRSEIDQQMRDEEALIAKVKSKGGPSNVDSLINHRSVVL
jgi:uncharacterized protein (DUF433 family)